MSAAYGSLAGTPQLGVVHDPGAELAVSNFSGVTLAAFTAVVIDSAHQLDSQVPSRTWSEGTTLGLGQLSIAVCLPTASTPAVGSLGVLRAALPSGGTVGTVLTRGIVPVVAAGSISSRSLLSICTVSGKVGRLQVAVAGEEIVAQALTDASDGDTFLCRLFGSVSIHA